MCASSSVLTTRTETLLQYTAMLICMNAKYITNITRLKADTTQLNLSYTHITI